MFSPGSASEEEKLTPSGGYFRQQGTWLVGWKYAIWEKARPAAFLHHPFTEDIIFKETGGKHRIPDEGRHWFLNPEKYAASSPGAVSERGQPKKIKLNLCKRLGWSRGNPPAGGEAAQPRGWADGWVCRGRPAGSGIQQHQMPDVRCRPRPAWGDAPWHRRSPRADDGKGRRGRGATHGPGGDGGGGAGCTQPVLPPPPPAAARPGPCGRAPPDTIGTGRPHGATAAPLPATAPARPAAQGGDGGSIILTHPSEEARRAGEGPSLSGCSASRHPAGCGARAERSVSLWQRPRRYSLHIAAGNGTAAPRRTAHAPEPSGAGAAPRLRRPQTIALPGLRALPARAMAGGKRCFPPRSAPAVTGPALSPVQAQGRRRTGRAVRRRDCDRDPQQRGDGLRRPPSPYCWGWAVLRGSASRGAVHAGTCSRGGGIPAIGKRDGLLALQFSAAAAGGNGRPSGSAGIPAGGSSESPAREGRTGRPTFPQPRRGELPVSVDSAGCSPGASGVPMRAPRGERALEESLERYQRRLRGERHRRGVRAGRPSRRPGLLAGSAAPGSPRPAPRSAPAGLGKSPAAGKSCLVLPRAARRPRSCGDTRASQRDSARAGALLLRVRFWFVWGFWPGLKHRVLVVVKMRVQVDSNESGYFPCHRVFSYLLISPGSAVYSLTENTWICQPWHLGFTSLQTVTDWDK